MPRLAMSITASAIGVSLAVGLVWGWVLIAQHNPLPGFLVRNGWGGTGIWIAIASTDFLLNLIMCLPAAWLLRKLGLRHLRVNTLLALLAFAATSSFLVGIPLVSFDFRISVQYLLLLASLPAAVCLLSRPGPDAGA